ncbi:MAG: endo alpha-1,4 polygalactosaminidase [gamma proteobacterium symbiont of Taylorina sp.]|nr:endo alpha-1,4 polygalactosaminidase [gamma proteobacterium symbiont of Taylorina sp.]
MADIGLDFKTETELNNNKVLSLDPQALPVTDGLWYRPEVSVSWQWHLNGVVNTDYQVKIYDIDLFESSPLLINQLKASGSKVICYFSAGSYENYRTDKDKFIPSELGNIMDGWPDEQWLDIRSENVVEIMLSRLDLAVQKGCDGVEPDNMDAYTNNSGFDLNANDQLAFNKLIANESHNRGLSVGLKNDLNQISELVDFFDFSVNEQCYEYDECNTLVPFINKGKPVLNAEYLDEYINDSNAREDLCQIANKQQFSTLILPLDLDDSFRYSCL